MPPLLCPSPDIIDQSFPRSNDDLDTVKAALGVLLDSIEEGLCTILLTQVLSEFIVQIVEETFAWEKLETYPDLHLVYRVLAEIGLQPRGVQRVNVSGVANYVAHPIPEGLECGDFAQRWSEEVGRLFVIHSQCCTRGEYFIGIACTLAFAGKTKGKYNNPDSAPTFPLAGPKEIKCLQDPLKWDIPDDMHRRNVSFKDAYRRIVLLGGNVHKPSGSSHYQVQFPGQRTWTLDRNTDPIPERFLRQLESITGEKVEVVKYVLLNGTWPQRIPRLPSRVII